MTSDDTRTAATAPDRTTGGEQHALARTLAVPTYERGLAGGSGAPNGLFVGPTDDTDRFELVGLGLSGGEGVTWCGRYAGRLNHPVTYAIKQLQPPASDDQGVWPTRADVRRWLDQRFVLQTVTNDHLVRLVDVFLGPHPHRRGDVERLAEGVEYATPYLVMEWVEGLTVAERVERRLDPVGDRMSWVLDIAEALEALHSASRTSGNPMLHRDVKPENCIVHPERGAVLVDVGALRGVDDGIDPRGLHTERYAAPEVIVDATAPRTTASDLYSLGALAFFCLVEDDPPTATQARAAEQIREALTAAVARHQVADPDVVTGSVLAMLSADPAARPTLPRPWARSLVSATTGRPPGSRAAARRRAPHGPGEPGMRWARRRVSRYAAALVALAAAGAVTVTQLPGDPGPSASGALGDVSTTPKVPAGPSTPPLAGEPVGSPSGDSPASTTSAGRPGPTSGGGGAAGAPRSGAGTAAVSSAPIRLTTPSPVGPSRVGTTTPAGRGTSSVAPITTPGTAVPSGSPSGAPLPEPISTTPPGGAIRQIQSLFASRCIDVRGPLPDDGTPLQLWDCINVPEERWSWDGKRLRGFADKCIDVRGPSTANGTPVQLYSCVDEPQQQWTLTASGELRVFGDRCLDVRGPVNANGTPLQIWECQDVPQQKWRFF